MLENPEINPINALEITSVAVGLAQSSSNPIAIEGESQGQGVAFGVRRDVNTLTL